MPLPRAELDAALSRVRQCLRGEPEALHALREQCHSNLLAILLSRGASRTEADDLLADLWADCVPGADDRPSLLEKFKGHCALQAWLATVATRRWIDLKRKQARRGEIGSTTFDSKEESIVERLPSDPPVDHEEALLDLLLESLRAAFETCPSEAIVMLRLRYIYGISQRELVRMLGWHESKVSRSLSHAMQEIQDRTLAEIKRREPLLELTWEDFLELCQTHLLEFL